MTAKDLLDTLKDLRDKEFEDFKWHLQHSNILEGYQPIKVSKLEKAERRDTVDVMLSTFNLHGALTVTKDVLKEMNRNDLVESLSDASSGPEVLEDTNVVGETNEDRGSSCSQIKGGKTSADSTSAAAPPAAAPATMMAQQGSVIIAPTVTGGTSGTWTININK